jgi:hypothetical protein
VTSYALDGFLEKLDEWDDQFLPRDDLRRAALVWLLTLAEHPYKGVKRAAGFDNLWYGAVPNTQHGEGHVVVCNYWIFESERLLRCDSFATLGLPI